MKKSKAVSSSVRPLYALLLALAALGPVPGTFISNPLAPKELGTLLAVVLGGALLALGLSRRSLFGVRAATEANGGSLRRSAVAVGKAFELADRLIRRWQVASISLLVMVALVGGILGSSFPR